MHKWLLTGAFALSGFAGQVQAQARHSELVTIAAGEEREVFGITFRADEPATAIIALSSELVTAAVLSGALTQGEMRAQAGEALVTPIDGQRTRRYGFDAQRLSASLPPQWQGAAEAPLADIADSQRRRAFWGMIEPVGVNAMAPVAPEAEAFRSAYLGNATILSLRRAAGGNRAQLASMTVQRFADALKAGDAATVADLIDPAPFSAASADPAVWLPARQSVAGRLAADSVLVQALARGTSANAEGTSFEAGGAFRIALVERDRALFVAAVEPLS